MNKFDAHNMCKRVGEFAWIQCESGRGDARFIKAANVEKRFLRHLEDAIAITTTVGMTDAAKELARLQKATLKTGHTLPAIHENSATARNVIESECGKRKFLYVAEDRSEFVDQERLFGDSVYDNFESARDDIREAGNCLAAECGTASVFHAMRAAEIGLRALAFDRRVKVFKNAKTMFEIPLELASWDQLIIQLEDAERAIQQFPQTLAREAQFEFYHGAMMQFRGFKNVFRNRVMHMRESFDRDAALSAVKQVREFMKILAGKIKEDEQTPEIWV